LGRVRDVFEQDVSPEVAQNLAYVLERLERNGALLTDMQLPESFSHVPNWWDIIKETELASTIALFLNLMVTNILRRSRLGLRKGSGSPGIAMLRFSARESTFNKR